MTVRRTATDNIVSPANHYQSSEAFPTFEELLLKLCFGNLDLDGLVNLFGMSTLVIGVVLDGG